MWTDLPEACEAQSDDVQQDKGCDKRVRLTRSALGLPRPGRLPGTGGHVSDMLNTAATTHTSLPRCALPRLSTSSRGARSPSLSCGSAAPLAHPTYLPRATAATQAFSHASSGGEGTSPILACIQQGLQSGGSTIAPTARQLIKRFVATAIWNFNSGSKRFIIGHTYQRDTAASTGDMMRVVAERYRLPVTTVPVAKPRTRKAWACCRSPH